MQRASRVGAALVAVADERRSLTSSDLAGLAPSDLLDAAMYHRVVGLVLEQLRGVDGVERAFLEPFAVLALQARARHLRFVADVHATGDVLDAAGVPWLVVKGPVLAEVVYPASGLRWYGDIDLVVPRERFADAVEALREAGGRIEDQNLIRVRTELAGQLNLSTPGGSALDLHWHVLFGFRDRARSGIEMEAVFARSVEVQLGDRAVRTFDPVDSLLHIAMHACSEGGDRLVWLKDVDQVVRRLQPDWDDVIDRAREWRVAGAAGLMLGRAARTIGTPVPAGVLGQLLPGRAMRATAAAIDRLWPIQHAEGSVGSPASLLARSMRGDTTTTLRALLGRIGGRATWTVRTRSLARPSGEVFPEQLGSPYVRTGTPTDLQAYFLELTSPERFRG